MAKMRFSLIILFLFSFGFFSRTVHSDETFKPIKLLEAKLNAKTPEEPKFSVFVISTEMILGKAKPILDRAPNGLYLTVGSERGFRGIAMTPNATHLILLDVSPAIIRFNRINRELLKSPSLEGYKNLRWNLPFDSWKKISKNLNLDDFKWWEENVRNFESFSYPIPELINRFGKDIFLDRFIKISEHLRQLRHQLSEKGTSVSEESLFFKSSYEDWTSYLKKVNSITLTQQDWTWWKKFVGTKEKPAYAYHWIEEPTNAIDIGSIIDYKTGNYLFDPSLYKKLHTMAIQGRIATFLLDLSDPKQVQVLASAIHETKLKLSVLDLDNTYFETYIGQKPYYHLVKSMLDLGNPNSVLLAMFNYKNFSASQFQTYVGFSFANIKSWPADFLMQDFFMALPKDSLDLINGRFYQAGEIPPLPHPKKMESKPHS